MTSAIPPDDPDVYAGAAGSPPARAFPGLWVDPEDDPREAIPVASGERGVLMEYLERYRMTLELKCSGLTPGQLALRSVPPSSMSLLGLLRHMARVEHSWAVRTIEGAGGPKLFWSETEPDLDFDGAVGDQAVVDDAWDQWRTQVAHAREVYADRDLDEPVTVDDDRVELRDIVVHMVEEYARHCGHADLLRECVDGRTGL